MAEQEAGLTPSQLKAILGSFAEQNREAMKELASELRRPADKTPEQLAAAESDRKMRMDTALLEKTKAENKRWLQTQGCSHEREDGTCAAVFVQGYNMIICQRCNALIYPEGTVGVPEGIYDTLLFNRLFPKATAKGVTF